jgi:hypothetical protein
LSTLNTEGGQLVTDIYQSAVNFSARSGAGLEVVHVRFVKNNTEMKQAIEQEDEDYKSSSSRVRAKRNIFGSLVSTLIRLATGALTLIQDSKLK